MASIVMTGLYALSQDLTTQEALSGVFGSISLATWIFLLVGDRRLNDGIFGRESADDEL
jgi:hypothetical protein